MSNEGPVHEAFGLTYSNYLVWPRSLMQEMPPEWQERFVALSEEFWAEWDLSADKYYSVKARENGRFVEDPLAEYRRPDISLIESLRRPKVTIIDDPLTVEEVDDGCELVDMAELAAALPSHAEWDHTAEEAGAWISVFCAGWVDLAGFRENAWRYAWEEHYCYNEEDFEPEDNVGEDNPPPWWGKPEPGREGKVHQVGQARHVYVRRVPWEEVAGADDDTFAWHLDVANKAGKGEGWFKATYMDLL